MHHVLTEFFGASVRVVIGPRPIDGFIFAHNFVLPRASHSDRGYMRIATQTVAILNAAGELDDFQGPGQIYVETLFLRLSIQRRSTVEDRVRGINKLLVLIIGQAETLTGQVAAEDSHAGGKVIAKLRKFEMKLHRLPQALARFR